MQTRLGALLGLCPECLWLKRDKCLACRRSGKWKSWLESTTSKDLCESLAWQLWKIRDAYWKKTGEPFRFGRDE